MRRCILTMLVVGLTALPSLHAQRRVSIGVAGGVSLPQGDLSDGANTGWHALGTLALGSQMLPLGLRLDVAYSRFAFSDDVRAVLGDDGNQTVGSATLNGTYRLPRTDSPMSPYLISGLGAYRTACSVGPACDAATNFGWNVGLGARVVVLGLRGFVEARYHRSGRDGSDVNYFPVTLGLIF